MLLFWEWVRTGQGSGDETVWPIAPETGAEKVLARRMMSKHHAEMTPQAAEVLLVRESVAHMRRTYPAS